MMETYEPKITHSYIVLGVSTVEYTSFPFAISNFRPSIPRDSSLLPITATSLHHHDLHDVAHIPHCNTKHVADGDCFCDFASVTLGQRNVSISKCYDRAEQHIYKYAFHEYPISNPLKLKPRVYNSKRANAEQYLSIIDSYIFNFKLRL